MTISEIEAKIITEFASLESWEEKYGFLVEIGRELPKLDPGFKTDQYVITGCQSKVWLHAAYREGKVFFTADSDAIITKGIVSLLIRVMSGQPPDDIINADMGYIDRIGLREHLSPTRSNGLTSMIKQMKLYALVFQTRAQQTP